MRMPRPLLALTATLLVSCTQIENPRTLVPTEPGVEATQSRALQRAQFEDIPVPPGFEYVTRGNRSYSYSQGGVRVGEFVYWGRSSVEDAAAFYRRTMGRRAYEWELVSEGPIEEGAKLDFRKGRQSCEVTITQGDGGTYVKVAVRGSA